jgi:hypothetical protein
MDPLTIAAICTLIVKNEAATTAVPPSTNCPAIIANVRASAARASGRIHDDADREAIARVAFAEAGNQGDRGIAAVVFTIINRLGDGRWGGTVSDVLNAPRQFEPVMRAGGQWRNLSRVPDSRRARIDAIVSLALKGELADETGGALYFQNPTIVAQRARAGQVSSKLVNFGGQTPSVVIGDHAFYRGNRSAGARRSATQTAQTDPLSDRQQAFIEAGGAIFGEAKGEAFDPATTWREGENGDRGEGAEKAEADQTAADILDARAPVIADGKGKPEEAEAGGMFVLRNGKTSASPMEN